MKNIVLLICLSLTGVICFTACEHKNDRKTDTNLMQEKIGQQTVQTLSRAQSVEIEDIEPSKARGYAFTGFGNRLTPSKAAELKKLLLNDKNYDFNRMKSCLFIPKIAFHFKSNDEPLVTILYSPWCKQIKIINRDEETVLEVDLITGTLEKFLNTVGDKA